MTPETAADHPVQPLLSAVTQKQTHRHRQKGGRADGTVGGSRPAVTDLRLLVTVLVLDQLVPLVHDGQQLLQQQRLPLLVGIRLLPV